MPQENDNAKDRLFQIMEQIEQLKNNPFTLSFEEECQLRTLEVQKMNAYSDWKDPQ